MILDFHTHIFPLEFIKHRLDIAAKDTAFGWLYGNAAASMAGAEELFRAMDAAGVQRSVTFGFPFKDRDFAHQSNQYVLEAARSNSRLIPFCTVNPKAEWALEEAEWGLSEGMQGLGEIAAYDTGETGKIWGIVKDLARMAAEAKVPILIHVNEPVGHAYPGKVDVSLGRIYELIRACPDTKMVLAHWGGGLFFYELLKKEAKEVLRNTWYDTAASPFLYQPLIYRLAMDIGLGLKILFGSDYPLIKPERYFKELEVSGTGGTDLENILGKNALRLLNYENKFL